MSTHTSGFGVSGPPAVCSSRTVCELSWLQLLLFCFRCPQLVVADVGKVTAGGWQCACLWFASCGAHFVVVRPKHSLFLLCVRVTQMGMLRWWPSVSIPCCRTFYKACFVKVVTTILSSHPPAAAEGDSNSWYGKAEAGLPEASLVYGVRSVPANPSTLGWKDPPLTEILSCRQG